MKVHLQTLILALGLTGFAFGQDVQPASYVALKNIPATDAVKSALEHATRNKLAVTVVEVPKSNAVFVAGESAPQKRIVELLTALDKPAPSVQISMTVVEVPADFAKDVGLEELDKWLLTPRETKMLTAAIRKEKNGGSLDVLSRPNCIVGDNQTGFFEIGGGKEGITIRATPRISPKRDSILLKVETAVFRTSKTSVLIDANAAKPEYAEAIDTQTLEFAESIPTGSSLVVHSSRFKTDRGVRDVMVVLTPQIAAPAGK